MFQAVSSFIGRRPARPVQSQPDIVGAELRRRTAEAGGIHRMHCILASWEEHLITADDAKAMLRREINQLAGGAA